MQSSADASNGVAKGNFLVGVVIGAECWRAHYESSLTVGLPANTGEAGATHRVEFFADESDRCTAAPEGAAVAVDLSLIHI